MNIPEGYSALDFVGFTDRGPYSGSETYVKNDLVHYNNSIWKCKLDDISGHIPADDEYWEPWVVSSTSMAGMTDADINTPANNELLVYNSSESKWGNRSLAKVVGEKVTFLAYDGGGE